jgi:hypothetical protein
MSKHICRVLHALTIVGILSASAPTAIAQSTNVRPDIVHHGFASALDGENLFVIGGLLNFEGNTRRLTANYKINLTTGDTASISTDVIFGNGNAAALWQGAIYVSGGSALVSHGIGNSGVYSTGFSDAFAVYDIANDTWRTLSRRQSDIVRSQTMEASMSSADNRNDRCAHSDRHTSQPLAFYGILSPTTVGRRLKHRKECSLNMPRALG